MFSPVASAIFTLRNIDKTENGEIGRAPVFIGQAAGVISEVSKYDNALAVGTKNALSVFNELSKENKALNCAGKFAKFASKNVNPLIVVSGVIKALSAEDKQSAAITELSALSAMFLGEGFVKNNYNKILSTNAVKSAMSSKYVKVITDFLKKNKLNGATGAVLKGLLFVLASIASYEAGHLSGDKLAKYVKDNLNENENKQYISNNTKEDVTLADTDTPKNITKSQSKKIDQSA